MRSRAPLASPPVIGILGGVASGKSLIARQLAELGGAVLDADRAGHEVLHDPEVKTALRTRWGDGVFGKDGAVNRAAVGRIVFAPPPAGPEELKFLEQVTHPRITQRLREQMVAASAAGARAIVLDAAVMLKAGWDRLCDTVWFVDVPREIRVKRAAQRGWSEEQLAAREAAQESLAEKRQKADEVIDNSGLPQATAEQVRSLWNKLLERSSKG